MDDLHNQLHALDDAFCQVTKPQTDIRGLFEGHDSPQRIMDDIQASVAASR